MSRRDDLVAAVQERRWDTVADLGWGKVFSLLKRGWAKTLDDRDYMAYALVLGDRDPGEVLAAVVALAESGAAEWRPRPAQIAAAMPSGRVRPVVTARPSPGLGRDAIVAVAALHRRGEPECECFSTLRAIDVRGVVRCMDCGGLNPGQLDEVLAA